MNRRRFLSCALVPIVSAVPVVAVAQTTRTEEFVAALREMVEDTNDMRATIIKVIHGSHTESELQKVREHFHKQKRAYRPSDVVTHGGSLWKFYSL